MTSSNNNNNRLIKFSALGFLVVQNAAVALVMRYSFVSSSSASPEEVTRYFPPVAVLTQEMAKFVLSILFLFAEKSFAAKPTLSALGAALNFWDLANVSVPAFLYVVQNNLLYVASANMSPAPLQLLFQLKIFTTAVLSVMILGKQLTATHWGALLGLFVGVAVIQLSAQEEAKGAANTELQNPLLGLVAIIIAVTSSGLAGVWFERILKKQSTSLWTSNFQLSLISIGIAWMSLQGNPPPTAHWYAGFTPTVWCVVALQSLGGLLIAVVVKYTDNIVKGYASSIATVLGTIGSVIWFDFKVSALFVVGSLLVLLSAYAYGQAERPKTVEVVAPPSIAEVAVDEEQQKLVGEQREFKL